MKYALDGFRGQAYFFGSRVDMKKRGGDIDVLLVPDTKVSSLRTVLKIQARFFSQCEQKLDVVVYSENDPFAGEVIGSAKRIHPTDNSP